MQVLASIQIKRLALVQVQPWFRCLSSHHHSRRVFARCSASCMAVKDTGGCHSIWKPPFRSVALQMNQTLDYSFENTPVSSQQANGSQVPGAQ